MADSSSSSSSSSSAGYPASPDGQVRFQVAVQKSRAGLYLLAFLVGLGGLIAGFWEISPWEGAAVAALGLLSAWLFAALYHRRVDEHLPLLPLWMGFDVLVLTSIIYLSGGAESPFFIWYLANAGAAAFVGGLPACFAVMAADTAAYVALLAAMGQIRGLDETLVMAVSRMGFLFGASFLFLRGVTHLRTRQRQIRHLRREERRRVEELSRLTRELDAANTALRELSLTDPLTGLRNRRFLEEKIGEDLATVRRHYTSRRLGRPLDPANGDLGFLIVDLDTFKEVNDRHGHAAGDRVLRELADVLRRTLRQNDTLVRWGGEEFLVLVRQANSAFLDDVARRIVARVESHPFSLESRRATGEPLLLTCSVGWSHYPFGAGEVDLLDWADIVGLADAALYLAKNSGRNLAVGLVPGGAPAADFDKRRTLDDIAWAVASGHLAIVSGREVVLAK